MNNGTSETSETATRLSPSHKAVDTDDLSRTKRELMRAEMRLAKARATAAAAEIDVKMLSIRLKSLAR